MGAEINATVTRNIEDVKERLERIRSETADAILSAFNAFNEASKTNGYREGYANDLLAIHSQLLVLHQTVLYLSSSTLSKV